MIPRNLFTLCLLLLLATAAMALPAVAAGIRFAREFGRPHRSDV